MELPPEGFEVNDNGYISPESDNAVNEVIIHPDSDRLQILKPFDPWSGNDFIDLPLLIKVKGKCTTDHISMAGPWLRFRGHLDKISDNLLMGAVNIFNNESNLIKNQLSGVYEKVSSVARYYKNHGISSVVVGDDNYGEGSSREHAAMEPRHLGVNVVLVRSFARIHETNLKKQGVIALTFSERNDYERIREDDRLDIIGLKEFAAAKSLIVVLHHSDGTEERFPVNHSYNDTQIEWFKAGSALNLLRKEIKGNK